MSQAKVFVVDGIGPVLVTVVSEQNDRFICTNPVQLKPLNDKEMTFAPLLDYMVADDEPHEFYKSSIAIVVNPNTNLAEAYIQATNPNAIITPPEKKIQLI